jgi:hypothetical protein
LYGGYNTGLAQESVYPNQGVLGEGLSVTLKGTGFDENTRVSTLDVGNKSVNTAGSANGITVVGDTAYVVDGNNGFQIIDISSFMMLEKMTLMPAWNRLKYPKSFNLKTV